MTLGELLKTCRREISDDGDDDANATIKTWQLTDYANDAEREACRRASLLVDTSTVEVCRIAVVGGTSVYPLDPRIIRIRRVRMLSGNKPLGKCVHDELDENRPGWEDETGTVEGIVTGMDTGAVRVYRTPVTDDTMALTVIRLPIKDMSAALDKPEINMRFHRALVFWMKHKAYANQDTEMYDPKLSAENYQLFEKEFGPAHGALNEVFDEMHLPFDITDGSY